MADASTIIDLNAQPICSTGIALSWEYSGPPPRGFEIERLPAFEEEQVFPQDRGWRRVATLPGTSRRFESIGLLNAPGRSWRHRVRALTADAAGEWNELPGIAPPQTPGGPRGQCILAASEQAPRNIHCSFIKRSNGELLVGYTASAAGFDYSRSWIAGIALTPAGAWEDRGILFPSRPDWPCVSRVSFVALPDGRIAATYSIGKPKPAPAGPREWMATDWIHRTLFTTSEDEGRTWLPERIISDQLYDYELANSNGTRNLVLSNGRLITSVHVCKAPPLKKLDPRQWTDSTKKGFGSEVMATYLLLSDDSGASWQRVPSKTDQFFFVPDDPYNRNVPGFHETSIAEYAPGKLLMVGRTSCGWLFETRSEDFGSTWTQPRRTDIAYSITPPNLTVIPGTSTIVLIGNPLDIPRDTRYHDLSTRPILSTQLSDDGGRTWYGYRELEYDGPADGRSFGYCYPDYLWVDDTLHIIYSRWVRDLYYQPVSKQWLMGRE